MEPPNWLRFRLSLTPVVALVEFRLPLRKNSNKLPCQLFVPDFVTMLTVAPAV